MMYTPWQLVWLPHDQLSITLPTGKFGLNYVCILVLLYNIQEKYKITKNKMEV